MTKNILITGGAGYIGSHISEILIKKNKNIFIVDNLSTGFRKLLHKKAKFFNLDIRNSFKLNKVINNYNIDSIIHLAAVLSVGESEKKPKKYKSINIDGTKKLLNSIKKTKVRNIIFSSTCAVYKDGMVRVNEKSSVKPTSVYGKTKLKGEKLIKSFSKKNGLNYGILRFFNVAGASASGKIGQINKGDQLFKNLSLQVKKKFPVFKIYGSDYSTRDGTCIRDYIHVTDLADIHLISAKHLLKTQDSHIFNCGYGKGYSVMEVVKAFSKFLNKEIKYKFGPRREGDSQMIVSNVEKFDKFFSWRPKFNNLEQIIKTAYEWEKKLNNTK